MTHTRNILWRITATLVFLLICGITPALAVEIPKLTDSWTTTDFQIYTPTEGFNNDPIYPVIYQFTGQDGEAFIGVQSFYDSEYDQNLTEAFSGVFAPDGLTFEIDNEGSGISFGETVSENELYIYTLLPERDLMVLVFHLVKDGTMVSPTENFPDIVGIWNLTHIRKNSSSSTGLLTIEEQQDRIWVGSERIQDEDGTIIEMPIAGTIGDDGKLYATTENGAFMIGSITGNNSIQSVLIIPGDTDGTHVIDRVIIKNGGSLPEQDLEFPDLEGEWKIDNRRVIQNGEISDIGPISDEWVSFTNQSGKFFNAVRHNQTAESTFDTEKTGIFYDVDEAFVTGPDSSIEIFYVMDNSTLKGIVNMKDNNALLYQDTLSRKDV